jgi:hypothetical protein
MSSDVQLASALLILACPAVAAIKSDLFVGHFEEK